MKNRGAGHLEMILSFLLFIGVVGVSLFLFSPGKGVELSDSSIRYISEKIIEENSVVLNTYSIRINDAVTGTALGVPNLNIPQGANSRVETYDGKVLKSKVENEVVYFDRESSGNKFIIIKLSKGYKFGGMAGSGQVMGSNEYQGGSFDSRKIMFESNMINLKDEYENSYDSLRERFDIPNVINFKFNLLFSENDFILAEREVSSGVDIFSIRKRVEIVRVNGEDVFADLIIETW